MLNGWLSKRDKIEASMADGVLTVNNLAVVYSYRGEAQRAAELFRRVAEARERSLGADHAETLGAKMNLALVLFDSGREQEAVEELERVLDIQRDTLGEKDPSTMSHEELMFHYFRIYDADSDGRIDGLEILKSITGHVHGDGEAKEGESTGWMMLTQILHPKEELLHCATGRFLPRSLVPSNQFCGQ